MNLIPSLACLSRSRRLQHKHSRDWLVTADTVAKVSRFCGTKFGQVQGK